MKKLLSLLIAKLFVFFAACVVELMTNEGMDTFYAREAEYLAALRSSELLQASHIQASPMA